MGAPRVGACGDFYRVDKPLVARALHALWEYRQAMRVKLGNEEKLQNPHGRLLAVIYRLNAGASDPAHQNMASLVGVLPSPSYADLLGLSNLEPNPRGFAFEKLLKSLFDTFGLKARDVFRLRGEQIDGSFILSTETYLLEAKWQNLASGVAELHTFHGKIEQKAAWSRGPFRRGGGSQAMNGQFNLVVSETAKRCGCRY
jgi:hypothetical protein